MSEPAHDTTRAAPEEAAPGVRRERPGWPEIAVMALAYVVLVVLGALVINRIPDDQGVARGLAEYALSGLAGFGAFAAALLLRFRRFPTFAVRRVRWTVLLLAAGLGVVAFLLAIVVSIVYRVATGDTGDIQSDYKSAAGGGALALAGTLLLGAVATPIGEEFAFRGVLANALGRYGPWISVLVSAAVFAAAHGFNAVLPVAFVVGTINAILLRRTGSVWPGVIVHAVNNTLATVVPLLAATATG